MSQPPPETGDPAIDAALSDVAAGAEATVAEQIDRLVQAQSLLAEALRTSREPTDQS